MWNKLNNQNCKIASGITTTLEELIALRTTIINASLQVKKNSRGLYTGHNITKIRGRGIEFDTTREYQAGDDIRRMAWRVTARSLKPHIKVYHEDKERPIWLAVDLSPSLYFGTRCSFKSVRSIHEAALLGWTYQHKRERVGAVIATPNKVLIYKPQSREREFLTILKSLSAFSALLPAFTENNCLHHLLLTMQQHIRSGHSLYIISDFFQFDMSNQKLILHFAKHVQVKLLFVYDPFEATSPKANQYILTDGQNTALLNMDTIKNRIHYQEQFQYKLNDLVNFSRKYNISLKILCTDKTKELDIYK
jgi:uncharacterized protein (DUF58 family)